jgi:ubiquinone biosynthesis accessory factor UbiJ
MTMNLPSPPPLLAALSSALSGLRPPAWLVDELQNRCVLVLNHVLGQEPAAMERLRRQRGKPLLVQWGDVSLCLQATAAGLLERADPQATPELTVTLTQTDAWDLVKTVANGAKPAVDVRGDVQFAAEVAWLAENVRWDLEEDLSRWIGDAPAHTLANMARRAVQAVKAFLPQPNPHKAA